MQECMWRCRFELHTSEACDACAFVPARRGFKHASRHTPGALNVTKLSKQVILTESFEDHVSTHRRQLAWPQELAFEPLQWHDLFLALMRSSQSVLRVAEKQNVLHVKRLANTKRFKLASEGHSCRSTLLPGRLVNRTLRLGDCDAPPGASMFSLVFLR